MVGCGCERVGMGDRRSRIVLVAGRGSRVLGERIAEEFGQPLGPLAIEEFRDGEIQPRFLSSIRGAYIFIIQSTHAPAENLLELLLTIDAARRASAGYITAVIPYFGYARQDRKDRPRVSIGAKLIADLIETAGAHRVMTLDLHAGQIQGFFNIPVDHLDSSYIFIPYLEELGLDDVVFAGPDLGASRRARFYAEYFNADIAFAVKYRRRANQVDEVHILGDVRGKNVVLVDDIVDTGGTLIAIAEELLRRGARSVRACVTHPVLSGNAITRIENSPLEELVVTDSLPLKRPSPKIRVLSCAPLFATAIRNMYENRSIDMLFPINRMYDEWESVSGSRVQSGYSGLVAEVPSGTHSGRSR